MAAMLSISLDDLTRLHERCEKAVTRADRLLEGQCALQVELDAKTTQARLAEDARALMKAERDEALAKLANVRATLQRVCGERDDAHAALRAMRGERDELKAAAADSFGIRLVASAADVAALGPRPHEVTPEYLNKVIGATNRDTVEEAVSLDRVGWGRFCREAEDAVALATELWAKGDEAAKEPDGSSDSA